ncbi:phage integrase SAM-like domain-containing protein, partial [Hymenobacter arcticus]
MNILSTEVKGIGIMPELSRHFTKKEGGHLIHFRLRRRADKMTLGYLSTDLYVIKAQFDPRTKNLISKEGNDKLTLLFHRAVAMLGKCKEGTDYKLAWQRDGEALIREQEEADRKELEDKFASGSASDHYVWLVNKSIRMAKELAKIEQEAEEMRIMLKLPPRRERVTHAQRVEYQDTMVKFMTLRRNTLSDRDFQMWTSWNKVLNEFIEVIGADISFAAIDMRFYRQYKTYLMVTRGNSANTFGAHVKKLKAFLKYAEGEGMRWSGKNGHGESNFPLSWKQKNQLVN